MTSNTHHDTWAAQALPRALVRRGWLHIPAGTSGKTLLQLHRRLADAERREERNFDPEELGRQWGDECDHNPWRLAERLGVLVKDDVDLEGEGPPESVYMATSDGSGVLLRAGLPEAVRSAALARALGHHVLMHGVQQFLHLGDESNVAGYIAQVVDYNPAGIPFPGRDTREAGKFAQGFL